MPRKTSQVDSFQAMTNPRRMSRDEIRGFQTDFNVNLTSDDNGDDWFDEEFEGHELTEISDAEFLLREFGDDLDTTDWSMRMGEMGC